MKNTYPILQIQRNKEAALMRNHPWIFSGAIQKHEPLKNGTHVHIANNKNEILATGHYQDKGSILVRVLAFENTIIDKTFYIEKIKQAILFRQNIHLPNNTTNCYRLIHGEGDNLPGLIIDIYDNCGVIQLHTQGMWNDRTWIAESLESCISLEHIVFKSAITPQEKITEYYKGNCERIIAKENDLLFNIDIISGQKTGFFLDQRNNRNLLKSYCKGKRILNTYCYSGGFSIYALKNGAKTVTSVDVSKNAIEMLEENLKLNELESTNHYSVADDVFNFMKNNDEVFDIVILDPPAFAKNINAKHNAVQAYKRLNIAGLKKLKNEGLLFTFSCSQVIDSELFYNTIVAAAIESGRQCKVIQKLSQPEDHPTNIFHPEGSYLKGLLLYVK